MQFTTQKIQEEEFQRLVEAEHRTLIASHLKGAVDCIFIVLAIMIPVLATALGWLKG